MSSNQDYFRKAKDGVYFNAV